MAMTTENEAVPTSTQIEKPCHDCPWRRSALKGWLGDASSEEWIEEAHTDYPTACHALKGPQCAGMAIYRANMCKLPRDPDVLVLPSDREAVFSTPQQFIDHHKMKRRKS